MQQQLNELKRLAASRVDIKTFYERLLREISDATSAEAGLVWNCSQPPYRLLCDHRMQSSPHLRASIQHQKHVALLDAAIQRNQPILIPPRAEATERLPVIALGPIHRDGEIELIELFLRPDGSEQDFKEWLTCLQEFCQVARGFTKLESSVAGPAFTAQADLPVFAPQPPAPASTPMPRPAPAPSPAPPASPVPQMMPVHAAPGQPGLRTPMPAAAEVEQFVLHLHQGLEANETMMRIANETRRFLNADRVSVVQWKRGRSRVQAVSGQPSVNQRSSTIQLLRRLVDRVLPLGELFWYPSPDSQTPPPEIEHPLNEYLTASTVRSLIVVPISDQSTTIGDDPDAAKIARRWIAGIVIEKFDAQWTQAELLPQVELVGRHAGAALRNAIHHRSLFLFPLWNALGKSRVVVAARNARRTTLIAIGVLLLTAILVFVPAPFRVACNGVLLPQERQNVFAQLDGEVAQVLVEHGSLVEKGQQVISLTNENLSRQREELLATINPLKKKLAAMDASLLNRSGREEGQPRETPGDLEQSSLKASLDSATRQLKILDEQIEHLTVESPMSGQVLSWDVQQQLLNKPVRRGDLLLEVADVNGPWELELKLPDKRIGHVLRAQQESGEELPVTFVLAANPNLSWNGKIISVSKITQDDSVDGQTIRVEVAFDQSALDIKQVRSGVMAKIHCGYQPIGYVWLHDIFEFFQSKVFFRLW